MEGKGIHTLDIWIQHMSRLSTVNTNTTPNSRTQIHVSERYLCKYVQHVAQRPGTNPAVRPSNVQTTGSNITSAAGSSRAANILIRPPDASRTVPAVKSP